MELAVLPAGVCRGGEVGEQLSAECAADEGRVEPAWVDADEGCLEPGVDELFGEFGGVEPPEREEPASVGGYQALLAVGANLLEEEVAVGDGRPGGLACAACAHSLARNRLVQSGHQKHCRHDYCSACSSG